MKNDDIRIKPTASSGRVPKAAIAAAVITAMLYAYGGFAVSIVSYYSPAAMAWVEQGGVYAVANIIRSGTDYPAIPAATADTDDRVIPAHSFKCVATLQAADIGARPHLLRVETRAGAPGRQAAR